MRFKLLRPAGIAGALLALCCLCAAAQNGAAHQAATAAPLNDALLSKATALYGSTAKSGLRSFDCALHPDWKKVIATSRKGAAVADDDPKLLAVEGVQLTLHARMDGNSSIDWKAPQKPADAATASLLDQARGGVEQTLTGTLKLWTPLVDGTVAESLGEEGVEIAQTPDGYTLKSKDKRNPVREEFDRNLVLKRFAMPDAGATVDLEPAYRQSPQGLELTGFVAHLTPAGPTGTGGQDMRVAFDYQSVDGKQIPAHIAIELPNLVEMDFALDGCTVNPASK
jgi:hypothetical protein